MSKRVVVTGAKGTIGTVAMQGLNVADITPVDLPDFDLRDPAALDGVLPGCDAIIHLAWTPDETYVSGIHNPDNLVMAANVFDAAVRYGIPRVIVASSIHIHGAVPSTGLLSTGMTPAPSSPYGQTKVAIEQMGKMHSAAELEVIALRFGGINATNTPPLDPLKRSRWLSHKDCGSLLNRCVSVSSVPNNFAVVWAVSNNPGRYHDPGNALGWHASTLKDVAKTMHLP